jgi:hypothetical protein
MLQFNCIYLLKYMTHFIVSDVTEHSSLRKVRVKEKICLVCVMVAPKTICSHLWKFCTTLVCSLILNLEDEISCFSSWILCKCLCKQYENPTRRNYMGCDLDSMIRVCIYIYIYIFPVQTFSCIDCGKTLRHKHKVIRMTINQRFELVILKNKSLLCCSVQLYICWSRQTASFLMYP